MSDLPLLPSDLYIASILGLTEEQYRYFQAEVQRRAAAQPRPAVVAEPTALAAISLAATLVSVGLTIAASFFKPKDQQGPQLRQSQIQGQSISNAQRFIARGGFDSVQDIASLGDFIPLIYACREQIDGQYFGGLRINAPLIWSQVKAVDKGQLLRAIFLIGEGAPNFQIDPNNIAIGNNTLGSYLLGDNENARFTVYFRPYGGRITEDDRVLGTSNDPGSLVSTDVYAVNDETGNPAPYFCHARRPTTQTQFGVYSLIGNGFGLRVNPSLRPGVNAQVTVDVQGNKKSSNAEGRVVCEPDYVSLAQREKFKAKFSGRSGLIDQNGNTWTYHLSNTSDVDTLFSEGISAGDWTTEVQVGTNPLPSIPDENVASWLNMSQVIVSSNSLTSTATLNTEAAEAALANQVDGKYVIEYAVYFVRSSKRIYTEYIVQIQRDTVEQSTGFVVVYSYSNVAGQITTSGPSGTASSSVNDRLDAHQERCGDVASAIAGRQKTWDDNLQIGELIKVGSALAIVANRTPSTLAFNSDVDFEPTTPSQGNSVDITLQVVRPGIAYTVPLADITKSAKDGPAFYTATDYSHLFRIAVANFSTLRECQIIEVCFRSTLGIRISGLCNFRDTLTYTQIDNRACYDKKDNTIQPGDYLTVDIFNSGQMNSAEERFSFFRVRYREAGTTTSFTDLAPCFGIRGITQQNVFNDMRFVMPTIKRWEFQIEPLSGWEIRSGAATGDLELLDSSLTSERTISTGGITVTFRGVTTEDGPFIPELSRSSLGPDKFRLASVQRGAEDEIGINYTDGTSYLDMWGKLAEAFVYEEVRTSAESSPEHEIVNVNEIIPNITTPLYDKLAILGFNVRFGPEFSQFGQVSVYATLALANGTHLYPEVLQDVLTNNYYGKGDQISNALIDTISFESSKKWCIDHNLFYDGSVVGRVNLRQWAADIAAAHLLLFGESGGRFWLRPAWPGTITDPEPVPIQGIFTAGNIIENSFSLEYLEPEDRRPIQVSVKYREERLSTSFNNPGVFPTEKEVLVREASTFGSETDPIETLDLSGYVTNRAHAILAAKFVVRTRRIVDHVIRFATTHEGLVATIQPGDYIRVALDISSVNELRNGAVLGNGALISTQPFSDGVYTILAWNGKGDTEPTISSLTVTDAGTKAFPTGIIFTLYNSEIQTNTYQIERITPSEDGGFSIEAVHTPTTDSGVLVLANGFDTESNWVIS